MTSPADDTTFPSTAATASPAPRTGTPESHGIPSAAIEQLIDDLERQGLDPHALQISRRGDDGGWTDVFTCAWQPFSAPQPALVYSVSKTFTSLAIGLLASEERLTLDDSVGDLLGLPNPHGLTVRHLLTMNTGHDPAQIDALGFDVRALLTVPPAATPGTSFAYNSDATYALSCIVTALTGERLTDYLRPRLLDPLGIGERWMKPARGVEQGFSGFHLTVGDIARVATMLADGGRFGGAQVVPAEYVTELSHPWSDTRDPAQPDDTDNDWGLGYGFQVWRSRVGFRLDGAYGQFGIVDAARGIVIAYQGSTLDTQSTLRSFWRLLDAVSDAPATGDVDASPRTDGPAAALADRAAALDSWSARDLLRPDPAITIPADGWRLVESATGWSLVFPETDTLEAVSIPVGDATWERSTLVLPAPPDGGDAVVSSPPVDDATHVAVAARGARVADGILVHLVVPTSPHRMIVRSDATGSLQAHWHTVPLQGPMLSTLAVPEWVIG